MTARGSKDSSILRLMRRLLRREPADDVRKKVEAIRAAAKYEFPAGDIEQILSEIESGYSSK
jgi:hypothetical protein